MLFNELKFTPGVGLSLLIGAVGSIYLIFQSHRFFSKLSQRRRSEIKKPDVVCYMCNANIEIEDNNSFATCRGCERLVCRSEESRCCEWIPAIGIWECRNCRSSRVIQQKAGEWLLNQLTVRLQNPGPVNLKNHNLLGMSVTDSDDAHSSTSSISSNQKIKVREFIEELLSTMLNGPLDDVSVGQLTTHESYLPICENQKVPDSPSDQHFELRKLLQRILDEVSKLPEMINYSGHPLRPEEHLPYFSPKKYEQLLATAVLNKVVDDYRNPKNFEHVEKQQQRPAAEKADPPTTGANATGAAPSATGTTFDINHNKVVPGKSHLNEANLRQMSLNAEEAQSKEELFIRSLSESDESYLSDYIQKHTVPLPDLSDTTGSGSGPEDDLVSLKSNATDGTWEENWLFKKRQLKSTESSIAMLVPSPTEEVKALIGDKNADEVSDLSEIGSDLEGDEPDSSTRDLATASKSSVGISANSPDNAAQDSLISINSIPSNEPVLSEAKNDQLLMEEECRLPHGQNLLSDDLISIEPNTEKTEAANPALLESKLAPFLEQTDSVSIDTHCNVNGINVEDIETDDVKLMQERVLLNAPKQRNSNGNIAIPDEAARASSPSDSPAAERDRKEIPIDKEAHANNSHTRTNTVLQPLEVKHINQAEYSKTSSSPALVLKFDSPENRSRRPPERKAPTLETVPPKSPPPPASPHPITMNVAELFERSRQTPLVSISEEDHESNTSSAFRSILSPADSVATADDSDYKTPASQTDSVASVATTEADTDTSLVLESQLQSLDSSVSLEYSRHYDEEQFSSFNIEAEIEVETEEDTTTSSSLLLATKERDGKSSPELLELNESTSDALFVADRSQIELVEQLKEARLAQTSPAAVSREEDVVVNKEDQICLGQETVAFNKNAASPDQFVNELSDGDQENSLQKDMETEKEDAVNGVETTTVAMAEEEGDITKSPEVSLESELIIELEENLVIVDTESLQREQSLKQTELHAEHTILSLSPIVVESSEQTEQATPECPSPDPNYLGNTSSSLLIADDISLPHCNDANQSKEETQDTLLEAGDDNVSDKQDYSNVDTCSLQIAQSPEPPTIHEVHPIISKSALFESAELTDQPATSKCISLTPNASSSLHGADDTTSLQTIDANQTNAKTQGTLNTTLQTAGYTIPSDINDNSNEVLLNLDAASIVRTQSPVIHKIHPLISQSPTLFESTKPVKQPATPRSASPAPNDSPRFHVADDTTLVQPTDADQIQAASPEVLLHNIETTGDEILSDRNDDTDVSNNTSLQQTENKEIPKVDDMTTMLLNSKEIRVTHDNDQDTLIPFSETTDNKTINDTNDDIDKILLPSMEPYLMVEHEAALEQSVGLMDNATTEDPAEPNEESSSEQIIKMAEEQCCVENSHNVDQEDNNSENSSISENDISTENEQSPEEAVEEESEQPCQQVNPIDASSTDIIKTCSSTDEPITDNMLAATEMTRKYESPTNNEKESSVVNVNSGNETQSGDENLPTNQPTSECIDLPNGFLPSSHASLPLQTTQQFISDTETSEPSFNNNAGDRIPDEDTSRVQDSVEQPLLDSILLEQLVDSGNRDDYPTLTDYSLSSEDTSTEAVAGSLGRLSSPEGTCSPVSQATVISNDGQVSDNFSTLSESSIATDTPPAQRAHSPTPIAVVTQQMRQYCEELKGILYPRKSPEPATKDEPIPEQEENCEALEFFQEELHEEDDDEASMGAQHLNALEIKTAESNQSVRAVEYVHEHMPIAEDTEVLPTEDLNLVTVGQVVQVTPSVEEHAIQEVVIVEQTPTPEPSPTHIYERQITATVEEVQASKLSLFPEDTTRSLTPFDVPPSHINLHDLSSISMETSMESTDDNLPPPPLEILQEQTDDDDEDGTPEDVPPPDSELSSLSLPLAPVCVLIANSDTNHTLTTATNNISNEWPSAGQQSFTSAANITITEPDSSQSPIQLPAQTETEARKVPPDLANGFGPPPLQADNEEEDQKLIPGSIAEREHLKWRNASPIPNNPYSPDVLQKRLSESNRKSNLLDFERLSSKDLTAVSTEEIVQAEPIVVPKVEEEAAEADRSLQSVLGSNPTQYKRYGRDYYINDAKRASGSRKQEDPVSPTPLPHSTDDEKSLLLSQRNDQATSQHQTPLCSPTHAGTQLEEPPGGFPFTKSSSCGTVNPANQTEDIFSAARPVEVVANDPILQRGTKLDYLCTPAREIYLVPAEEPITPRSLESSSEMSAPSRADESLTYSEDSDVTRIYEVGTGESKVVHGDFIGEAIEVPIKPVIASIREYESSLQGAVSHEEQTMNKLNELKHLETEIIPEEIVEIIPQVRTPTPNELQRETAESPAIDRTPLLKSRYVQVKPLSPETIKFFSPKKPFAAKGSNLSSSLVLSQSTTEIRDLPHHPPTHYHSSLHIDFPASRAAPCHEFIIEKEVMEVLPSVKELAKCYSSSQQDVSAVPKPIVKPRDFVRQSSDMLNEEPQQEVRTGMPQVDNKNRRMYCSTSSINAAEEIREIRRLNLEAYNRTTFVPMAPGHSITARSLSKQIRDELKTNATDDHKVQGGRSSPERPSSPVFAPGHLRTSIEFFESLKNK